MQKQDHESQKKSFAKYLRYSHLGLTFFLAVFLFTWAGIWLDGRLDTAPLFTLLGLAIGFAGGLYSILRELYGSGRNK